ncbi:MAG: site-2 protease family protein [Thermodesulfobacteriota bacterium]
MLTGRGIRLFKVLGIRISVDYTWFIVFALFAWSLSNHYFPSSVPGLDPRTYLAMGVVSSLLLFVCILIHELAHSYVANRLGLDIREITLFIFGGVARMTREPEEATAELKIAIAGPLASLALAAVFRGLEVASGTLTALPVLTAVLGFLATVNVVLLVFNMIPGFPLDGGRVLRALWWATTGDIRRATRAASLIGKGFALFLIVGGFVQLLKGNFVGGIWFVLIGVFLRQAAESSYQQLIIKMTFEGLRIGEIMTKEVVTLEEDVPLSMVVEKYFFNYHFVSFPVVREGRVVGLLTLNDVRGVEKERWGETLVRDVMEGLTPEMVLSPDDNALKAISKMTGEGTGRFPVLRGEKLVGILTRRDIMRVMELKSGLGE